MIGVVAEAMSLFELVEYIASSALTLPRFRSRREGAPRYERVDGRLAAVPHPAAGAVLAEAAVERNAFASVSMLHAAATHLSDAGEDIRTLVVEGPDGLAGMLQVKLSGPLAWPRVATVWAHAQTFDTTPVIAAGAEERFFHSLFAWLDRNGVAVLRWPRLALDGPAASGLEAYLERTGRQSALVASHARPLLDFAAGDKRPDLAELIPHKRRRDIERCRRRLSALGTLSFRTIDGPERSTWWAKEFLRIEASGWKGEAGTRTALACNKEEHAFFLRVFEEAALGGQLLAHCLELDGVPIAMTVNFRCGGTVWAYKTAYDAGYSRFGPGALLEVEGTAAMLADPTVMRVDSCSDGGNALIREIWRRNRLMGEVAIAVRPGAGSAARAAAMLLRFKAALRARLKAVAGRRKGRR